MCMFFCVLLVLLPFYSLHSAKLIADNLYAVFSYSINGITSELRTEIRVFVPNKQHSRNSLRFSALTLTKKNAAEARRWHEEAYGKHVP